MLSLLLEFAVYGLLAYGTAHYFGLEADWEQYAVRSRTSECQLGARGQRLDRPSSHPFPSAAFTFHQFSQWLKMVTLPTMWLGVASLTWEVLTALWRYVAQGGGGRAVQGRPDGTRVPRLQVDPGARVAEEAPLCSPAVHLRHCHGGLVCDQPGG